jgi:hypothetical protein
MGSSDPLPAGLEIRFGSLNFQATGNDYLMRLTNREELRVRRQAGFVPVAATRVVVTPTPSSMDAAGPLAPRRRRRSGQRSRQARLERRHAAHVASQRDALTGETTAATAGERSVLGPCFPIGLRGATMAYVASAKANAAMCRVHPGRHVPVARDPSASTDDESSQGSADELPPATSHRYTEWDFSGVPDLVMFRRFLDATDYWFGYSDDSSAGSYDPARECCVVITSNQANTADAAEAGEERFPSVRGLDRAWLRGQAPLPPHRRGGPASMRSWSKHASLRPSSRRNTARCGCFESPSPGKPPHAGERARELGRQARDRINTDFNIDDAITPPRASQKLVAAAMLLRAMPAPRRPRCGTCTARRRHSSNKRPSNRPKVRRLASASREVRGTTGARGVQSPRCTRAVRRSGPLTRGARRPRSGSSTRAGKPRTATPATSSTPRG